MFAITIALGNASWRLLYKEKERAEAVFEMLKPRPIGTVLVSADDDFGQKCELTTSSIHGMLLEDMDRSKLAQVELSLWQAKAQIAANNAAKSDPAIRAARTMNGPSPFSPVQGFSPN